MTKAQYEAMVTGFLNRHPQLNGVVTVELNLRQQDLIYEVRPAPKAKIAITLGPAAVRNHPDSIERLFLSTLMFRRGMMLADATRSRDTAAST
jgi:hypothetical protein